MTWVQPNFHCLQNPNCPILDPTFFFLFSFAINKRQKGWLQCLQSSRSHVGGSNLDFCVEEKFQMTLNPWTGRSQLLPETFKFELRPVWCAAGTERHSPPLLPPGWRDTDSFSWICSVFNSSISWRSWNLFLWTSKWALRIWAKWFDRETWTTNWRARPPMWPGRREEGGPGGGRKEEGAGGHGGRQH